MMRISRQRKLVSSVRKECRNTNAYLVNIFSFNCRHLFILLFQTWRNNVHRNIASAAQHSEWQLTSLQKYELVNCTWLHILVHFIKISKTFMCLEIWFSSLHTVLHTIFSFAFNPFSNFCTFIVEQSKTFHFYILQADKESIVYGYLDWWVSIQIWEMFNMHRESEKKSYIQWNLNYHVPLIETNFPYSLPWKGIIIYFARSMYLNFPTGTHESHLVHLVVQGMKFFLKWVRNRNAPDILLKVTAPNMWCKSRTASFNEVLDIRLGRLHFYLRTKL